MGKIIRSKDKGIAWFQTDDIALAAALSVRGHEPIVLHSLNNSVSFHFEETKLAQQDLERFWSGHLLIDAMTYWVEIGSLIEAIEKEEDESY